MEIWRSWQSLRTWRISELCGLVSWLAQPNGSVNAQNCRTNFFMCEVRVRAIKPHWNQLSIKYLPVSGLELLGEVHGVVDEGEASRLAAAELGLEAECEATISSARVHLCQLLPHLEWRPRLKQRTVLLLLWEIFKERQESSKQEFASIKWLHSRQPWTL